MISITRSAIKQMKTLITQHNAEGVFLSLNSGGCNGFKYELNPFYKTDKLEKTDVTEVIDSIPVHICGKGLMYILGTNIDYQKDFVGERFVFKNDKIQAKCGCGVSFTFDDDTS